MALLSELDDQIAHLWMVRTFLKHCDEAEDDEDLRDITRDLYDFILALGPPITDNDLEAAKKQAKKKIRKLVKAESFFREIQPEISGHTNFQMAAKSLRLCVARMEKIVQEMNQ
ncbi:MAG: amidohydrolase [Planctomycetota bacterium]